jgi:hypothetical protein
MQIKFLCYNSIALNPVNPIPRSHESPDAMTITYATPPRPVTKSFFVRNLNYSYLTEIVSVFFRE